MKVSCCNYTQFLDSVCSRWLPRGRASLRNISDFTHVDHRGQPAMVDVAHKAATKRIARARTIMQLPASVYQNLNRGEILAPKGPVFATAVIAGTMAAKKTADLIPFCHPLPIEQCDITIELKNEGTLVIEAVVGVTHKTGVEMEALTASTITALTIYDMCKAISHDIVIRETVLLSKTGGKSNFER
ncbi:molybdenum cofactor biosynthesis protein C [Planoprotostelium fungivorum]|uniref:cyclic pyranopterin monophosphate synthase n=1 Tax=Planoprotostelium fungivorum TaxID=1890364 RepID=A0A2P6N6N6_9EUKA|nr:molybdenum cofactor biosynthesis protein C [Planoprotostelium fungivorum]